MDELKPCPFCGNTNPDLFDLVDDWGVECVICPAQIVLQNTRAEAIAAWNTRTHDGGEHE